MNNIASLWLLLIISLPSNRATPRMRVWRALKTLGAGVLRDGVYVLPQTAMATAAFEQQAQEIKKAGGVAHLLAVECLNDQEHLMFLSLFDRTPEYTALRDALLKLQKLFKSKKTLKDMSRKLKRRRRDFAAITAMDYFPGEAKTQVEYTLTELERALENTLAPNEPRAIIGTVQKLNKGDYQRRTWATRAHPWVDRIASAWLIHRFIDRKAKFLWLKNIADCPPKALGFDFDGATFTHIGARVTFEVLLASFDLETDTALTRLGAVVHYLDAAGIPVADAPGFERMLLGVRARTSNDNAMLAEAEKILDFMYAAYTQDVKDTAVAYSPKQKDKSRRPARASKQ